ncbi:hypothetical protein GH733_008010, partial [Mirounga leonina]
MDEVESEKQYAVCSVPSCVSSCLWALLLLNIHQVGFLVNEDLKNCLWTQAPCQCMRHTPTLPSLPGTLPPARLMG